MKIPGAASGKEPACQCRKYKRCKFDPWVGRSPRGGNCKGKASTCNAGDSGLIPKVGSSPGEGNGNPLQYSYLEKPMDRGPWWATVHRVIKSQT